MRKYGNLLPHYIDMGNLEMVFERIFDASFFKVTLSNPSRCVALKALESSDFLKKNKCKSFSSPT